MASEVTKITLEEDIKQYSQVSAYCFFDREGWSERMFRPEAFQGDLYGCREQDRIMSGVVSHDLSFTYWGKSGISSSGIGGVASDPAVRNKGHIRDIMNRILQDNYRDGKILSFLYPFSYRYYGMFGYGTMGPGYEYKFNPEEIIKLPAPAGEYTLFDGSEKQYGEYVSLVDKWAAGFNGGVSLSAKAYPLEYFNEDIKRSRQFLYFYRDEKGVARSCLLFKMEEGRMQRIRIQKAAWTGKASFRALLHFLWRHRGQVGEVFWGLSTSVPLDSLFREPRIHRDYNQMWMGRPVNVLKALKIKSAATSVNTPFAISLEDPSIPENSGTYRLEGSSVVQEKTDPKVPVLDFSVFSALAMGGLSLDQAEAASLVPEGFTADRAYLARLENICITEGF